PHPGTESAAKNLLVGPPVAIMDRVRDMIRDARDKG
ncbi:hemerythrin domain-containing protein, partial [Actinomadura sp. 6K520]